MRRNAIASVERDAEGQWHWNPTARFQAICLRSVCLGASDDFRPDFLGYVPHYVEQPERGKWQAMNDRVVALNRSARATAKADPRTAQDR
jgi:hypothetical protein